MAIQPEKMNGGWAGHAEAHNNLVDYVHKTHPISTHGHRETINGIMPPPRAREVVMQFTPHIHAGEGIDEPAISISPGYVFGGYSDGATTDSTEDTTVHDTHQIQQTIIEPTIAGQKLTNSPAPSIPITYPGNTYFFLKLDWKASRCQLHNTDAVANHNLRLIFPSAAGNDDQLDPGDRHSHAITGDGTIADVGGASGMPINIDVITYTLSAATFIAQAGEQAPPLETELLTHIPAGYISLDEDGQITNYGDDDGLRWFLQGGITAYREMHWGTGELGSQDRVEPVPPTQAENYTMPGQATDA